MTRSSSCSTWSRLVLAAVLMLAGVPDRAHSTDTQSARYRLVGAGNASVSAQAASPAYRVYLVGGAGEPTGIAASPDFSVVSGGTSNALPTSRIFRSGME